MAHVLSLDLDAVPWASLEGMLRLGGDTPTFLRTLADPTTPDAAWERARGELFDNVWHQCNQAPLTVHVIPRLAKIALASRDRPDRTAGLINDLLHLGCGCMDQSIDIRAMNDWIESAPELERPWGIASRDSYLAVERLIPDLLPLLDTDDEQQLINTAELFGWFPAVAAQTVPVLREALAANPDVDEIEEALAKLEQDAPPYR